jgi:hypothetical protein
MPLGPIQRIDNQPCLRIDPLPWFGSRSLGFVKVEDANVQGLSLMTCMGGKEKGFDTIIRA